MSFPLSTGLPLPFGLSLSKPARSTGRHFDRLSANGVGEGPANRHHACHTPPFGLSLSKPARGTVQHFDKLSANGAGGNREPA
jgi:hypothetical protein